jgi:hypothetical protein
MEVVLILLYVVLIIFGIISIINALVALHNDKKTESESSLETKWFKWKAPVRLVFGLICILLVIIINKYDFYKIDKQKIKDYESRVEELTNEKEYYQDLAKTKDSTQVSYYLILDNETGKSFNHGEVLISNTYETLTIKGGTVLTENRQKIKDNKIRVISGDKFFINNNGNIWGVNVLDASNNYTHVVKLEVYKEILDFKK